MASPNFLGRNWKILLRNESIKYMDRYNQAVLIKGIYPESETGYRKKLVL